MDAMGYNTISIHAIVSRHLAFATLEHHIAGIFLDNDHTKWDPIVGTL